MNREPVFSSVMDPIRKYAVIDLHLHLDGSISVASARELAAMQSIEIPETDAEIRQLLQVEKDCRDLNEYLEKFQFPLTLLQTKAGIETAVYRLHEELKQRGLLYAEIRFAPQLHLEQGLSQLQVVEAAVAGRNRSDFRSTLILCCMRGRGNSQLNLDTVSVAKAFLGKGVGAVDLAGAEGLFPTTAFEAVFSRARELGVPYAIHAGEADGPDSVRAALAFGAVRIGHGVRAQEDPALMQELSRRHMVLELCPTSNLQTKVFRTIEEYPIRRFLEAGVPITVNSDNMMVSGTDVQSEFRLLTEVFALTETELRQLAVNAVNGSFADPETKRWLMEQLGA